MEAWAHDSFGNDDAMDWVGELEESKGTAAISTAFEPILNAGDEYVEAPEASMALAAAEVVAALQGKPATKLPEEVTIWLAGKKPPGTALVKTAQQVVKRILADSELKELWAESDDSALWQRDVENLLRRLNEAATNN